MWRVPDDRNYCQHCSFLRAIFAEPQSDKYPQPACSYTPGTAVTTACLGDTVVMATQAWPWHRKDTPPVYAGGVMVMHIGWTYRQWHEGHDEQGQD